MKTNLLLSSNLKYTRVLTLFCLLLFGVGQTWGTEYTWTCTSGTFPTTAQALSNSSDNNIKWTASVAGSSQGTGTTGEKCIQIAKNTNLTLSTSSISGTITSITLQTWGSKGNKLTCTVGSYSSSTNIPTSYSSTGSTVSFTPNTSGTIKLEWEKNSDKTINVRKIIINYSASATTYTISYDANGGTGTMTDSNSPYNSGTIVTIKNNTFTAPEGKEFDHWNTASDNTGTNYYAGDSFSISDNIILYAQWKNSGSSSNVVKCGVFKETWDDINGTGGNDGSWSGNIATNNISSDNEDWVYSNGKGASKCAKFGTGSAKGSAQTPAITYTGSNDLILEFKAGAWNGNSEKTTLNLSATNATLSESSVTLKKGEWTTYTINITSITTDFKIKWEANDASNNRFFLDEVCISEAETEPETCPKPVVPNNRSVIRYHFLEKNIWI